MLGVLAYSGEPFLFVLWSLCILLALITTCGEGWSFNYTFSLVFHKGSTCELCV
jgi:hypothetical protein